MNFDITYLYFLIDIVFYYLVLLLIRYSIKYVKAKQNKLEIKEIIIPIIAIVGIISILMYALIFDRDRLSVVPSLPQTVSTPSPTPEPRSLISVLKEMNSSGEFGNVEISSNNGGVQMVVRMKQNQLNADQPASIYTGTCGKIGERKYELPDIMNNSGKNGNINIGQIMILQNIQFDQLMEQLPLIIVVYKSIEEKDTIVSCGEIDTPRIESIVPVSALESVGPHFQTLFR